MAGFLIAVMPSWSRLRTGCDNLGVVGHGQAYWAPLAEKQAQSDVLRVYKRLISTVPVRSELYHVYAHQDKYLL